MSISRLQLAAALLEYDNDEDLASPSPVRTEFKDHRQSAIFQPFQQAKAEARRQQILSQPAPSLPSLLSSAEQSVAVEPPIPKPEEQKWRKSTLGEFNPLIAVGISNPSSSRDSPAQGYGADNDDDDEDVEEDLADVDVARWGLPSHLVVEEEKKAKERKRHQDKPESSRRSTVPHPTPQPTASPMNHSRVKSIHMSDVLDDTALHRQVMAETQAKLEGGSTRDYHRRALSYDRYGASQALVDSERTGGVAADRPATAMGMQNREIPERIRTISDPMMLPLPRSPVSAFATNRPTSSLSRGWTSPPPGRMYQEEYIEDEEEQQVPEPPNPFALPAPPPELGSRFDPKVLQHQRQPSSSSMPMSAAGGTDYDPRTSRGFGSRMSSHMQSRAEGYFDQQQQQQPPHSATSSSHHWHPAERESMRSPGEGPLRSPTVIYDDIPTPEAFGRPLMPKRYSTSAKLQMDRSTLLRPKTLIMPTPLANRPPPTIREPKLPEGYTLGEKPLPYEARTMGDRPGMPLSLSQKTFRSSLMVGGTREDEFWVGGAEEEGEVGVQSRELDEGAILRKPGKLYGKSLMDQLEARKAALKGRQRVFTGDARPAMMARSTMYDMPTVSISPTSPEQHQQQYSSSRHSSMLLSQDQGRAPLLAFDSNGQLHPTSPGGLMTPPPGSGGGAGRGDPHDRIAKSKSVFGVDQIWEKEMSKLRQMQEDERRAEETRRAIEEAKKLAEEEKKKRKSKKGKGKDGRLSIMVPDSAEEDSRPVEEVLGISPINRAHDLPPALEFEPEKAPPQPPSEPPSPEKSPRYGDNQVAMDGKVENEEEEGPHSKRSSPQQQRLAVVEASDSDSDPDADVPLSRLAPPRSAVSGGSKPSLQVPARAAVRGRESESVSDSDEDVPLSKLSIRSPATSNISHSNSNAPRLTQPLGSLGLSLPTFSPTGSGTPSNEQGIGGNEMANEGDEDEDDQPLAVKQAKAKGLKPITKADIIEDDLPLGYKHAEKAQKQMAERSSQVGWQGDGRNSAASFNNNNPHDSTGEMGMNMGMGGMGWDPHQSFMAPQQYHNPMVGMGMGMGGIGMNPYPYGGGYPSMPNLNYLQMNNPNTYPYLYQMGMGMGMSGQPPMGGGDINMGVGMGMGIPPMGHVSPQNPGKAIDNWRQDVALAPVPTGSGSGSSAGGAGPGPGGAVGGGGGGVVRRSVVG
ncbi:hypothetical protein I317_07953 [Kwoniella heveanensis CBS 569]|nr:hypothetical protein I317_07953 [Kwoniella heveanensis CBS 569]